MNMNVTNQCSPDIRKFTSRISHEDIRHLLRTLHCLEDATAARNLIYKQALEEDHENI